MNDQTPAAATEAAVMEAPVSIENLETAAGVDVAMPTPGDDIQAKAEQAHRDAVEKLYNHLREIAADPTTALEALSVLGKKHADTVVAVVKDRFEQAKLKAAEGLHVVADKIEATEAVTSPAAVLATPEEVIAKVREAFKESPLVDLASDPANITYALMAVLGKNPTLPVDVSLLPALINEAFQGREEHKDKLRLEEGELWLSNSLKQALAEKGALAEEMLNSWMNAPIPDMTPEQKASEAWAVMALLANTELALAQEKVAGNEPKIVDNIYFNRYSLLGALPVPEQARDNVSTKQYQDFALYNVGKAFLNGHLLLTEKEGPIPSKEFGGMLQKIQTDFMQKDAALAKQVTQEGKSPAPSAIREGEPSPNAPKAEPKKPTFLDKLKHNLVGVAVTTAIGAAAIFIPFFEGKNKENKISVADKLSEAIGGGEKSGLVSNIALTTLVIAASKAVMSLINPMQKAGQERS